MSLGVCMIVSDFYPLVGGMQTHTLVLAQRLQAMGVDVQIITRRYRQMPPYEELNGLPIHRTDVRPDASKSRAAVQFMSGALKLMRQQRERFQIIHSHQVISPTTIGLVGRELMQKKLIVNPHSPKRGGGLNILLQRRPLTGKPRIFWMKKRSDAFVAISQEVKRDLIDLGFPPGKIAFIPNGVDTTCFAPLSAPEKAARRQELDLPEEFIIIYVGRLSVTKQLDVLLRAFANLVSKSPVDTRLLVLGDGPERRHLEEMAVDLEIGRQVAFVGSVPNVKVYLQASDAFALPSRSEGLPIALLEAMACGLPCIASATGGVLDVILSEVNGLTFPSGDVHALQSGLETLLSAPTTAARLGREARLDICRNHSIKHTAQKYLQLYRNVLTSAPLQLMYQ